MITVYSLPCCPNCDSIKETFKQHNILFDEKTLEDEEVKLDLLMDSVTLIEAPIIKIDNKYMNMKDAIMELNL